MYTSAHEEDLLWSLPDIERHHKKCDQIWATKLLQIELTPPPYWYLSLEFSTRFSTKLSRLYFIPINCSSTSTITFVLSKNLKLNKKL